MTAFRFFLPHSLIFLCYIGFPTTFAKSGNNILGNETDRLALLSFKDHISHDPLQVTSSWNDSFHFCVWKGVTCGRRHQRVIMLNLQSQGLVGSLSPYIGNLSFLKSINLENNSFQGEIPQDVGRLFRLREFKMSNNSFAGEIPVNLSHCSNLEILRLGQNKLVGKIPTTIGSLSKLVGLSFARNNLNGEIPLSFGNLSSLNILSLGDNSLQGSIPYSLGQLKNLKALDLGPNILSGTIPPSLYNLSSLEIISLASNRLNGSLPPDFGLNLPNLRLFYIAANQFSGFIPVSLFNASRLEKLEISKNNFSGMIPIEVGNLKRLQFLRLADNNLGSGKSGDLNFLDSFANTTNLVLLDITSNHFGGQLPNSIANLSNQLNQLYLGTNQISGSIPSEIGNLVNLIALYMDNNLLTGSIPNDIRMLQNLQALDLSGNRFSGQINPFSLGNNSQLFYLNLSGNMFEGNIISYLGNYQHLQILDLSKNNFNGSIPKQIIGLSPQLTTINLASNSFTGSLPLEVANLKNIGKLDVSKNKMSGTIPSTLGSCSSLERLFLHNNFFEGSIPPSFSSLKGIQYLDLSSNNLSGKIPKDLDDLSFLQYLNMSFNDLEGEVPLKGVFQNASAFSIHGNSRLCGGIRELQLPACPVHESKNQGISLAFKVTIGIILSTIVVAAAFLAFYWRIKPRTKSSSTHFSGGDWFKRVSYNELHKATGGFTSTNLIGAGNFGSVYKGVLYQERIPIAVKVLNLLERGASKSFIAECNALREVRHRNLVKILTSCSSIDFKGNAFKALVFELMPNGNLENWLHPSLDEQHTSRILNLHQRLNIAIDVASALDYLHNHCQTPIIHCDLKPSNVLLDDDMAAHVGDFGLAKFLTKRTSNSEKYDTNSIAVKGTIGYIPPEYGTNAEISTQGDVYSYGILLLEMFTGKKPTDDLFKDGLSLHHFSKMALTDRVMEIADSRLLFGNDHNETINDSENQRYYKIEKLRECLISIFKIGVACSVEALSDRMKIKDALMEIHLIKETFLG